MQLSYDQQLTTKRGKKQGLVHVSLGKWKNPKATTDTFVKKSKFYGNVK